MAKLKKKTLKSFSGKVYDLSVEKSHSYNINGISVHNSAAGCLLSWCLDITKIDPLRFGLYFERFLNPSRKGNPDIDVDYMTDTDHITNEFLLKKYGRERILNVGTFLTFNEKGCLKDVVRALKGKDESGQDSAVFKVTDEMPNFDKVPFGLKEWFEDWPKDEKCSEIVRDFLINPDNKKVLDMTLKLQGQVRGIGQHAAGIVITPTKSWECIPTNAIPKDGGEGNSLVTAFQEADKSGKDLSTLGILKLDRLKLETLNIIKDAVKLIKDNKGKDITNELDFINLDDSNLYDEVRLGLNHGIFQFESPGMNALIKGVKVETFGELTACNALYRPGPMGIKAHEEYIRNKFAPSAMKYIHPMLEPILSESNGVMIYQEQLMFIASKIGNMSLGEGDNLRRAMDKASSIIDKDIQGLVLSEDEKSNKEYKSFLEIWDKFLKGAESNGFTKGQVEDLKAYIIKYLGYSFNKSHSVSYAYLATQTLYLKHYYPTEFYTSLLNHCKSSGKPEEVKKWVTTAIICAMSKGIRIQPPSRKSGWDWTMTGDKEISMGFSAIKGFGDVAYNELMDLLKEKGKKFEEISKYSFFELKTSKFNKSTFEACLKAGLFDDWSPSRKELVDYFEKSKKANKKINASQLSIFGASYEPEMKHNEFKFEPTNEHEKKWDFLEVCNFDFNYIQKIYKIKQEISERANREINSIHDYYEKDYYWFILDQKINQKTKTGKKMLTLKVTDGITNSYLRLFSKDATDVEGTLEIGGIYVGYFEKNQQGFMNFKKKAKKGEKEEKLYLVKVSSIND